MNDAANLDDKVRLPMEFDSPDWRSERNRKVLEWLKQDRSAYECVLSLWDICEAWDGAFDGDYTNPAEEHAAWRAAVVMLERNRFYQAHPQMRWYVSQCAIAWETANRFEKSPQRKHRETAFFLRNLSTSVVVAAADLIGGYEHALRVSAEAWDFFTHELLADWEHSL